MTQNTQTTAERIFALIFENIGYTDGDDRTVAAIAAEIDALTAERDKAQAEVERLRLPAEAWETLEAAREAGRTGTEEDEDVARSIHKAARDRARAAQGGV